MSNQEIFILPGHFLLKLLLSLIGIDASTLSEETAMVWHFILALLFWMQTVSIVVALIKKKFGFHTGGQQR